MVTSFREKSAKLADLRTFVALAFWNGLEYRNADRRVNSAMNWPTSRRNLVRFNAATLEFSLLVCVQQASISTGVSVTRQCSDQS